MQTGADIFAAKNSGYAYTRADNPNARQLAAKLALLEGIDLLRADPDAPLESLVRGRMFASRMAATSTAVMARVQAGSTILTQNILYGNAYNLLKKVAPLYGIRVVWVKGSDPQAWEEAFEQHPRAGLVYLETPPNPAMEIVDIAQVAQLASRNKAWVMVDNTFATPYCQRPLSLGADIVVHSTTKFLSGHGLILGGAVITRHPEFLDPQKERFIMASKVFGGTPSPFDTWLTNIGLKTFELRMQRHIENAARIADWLAGHPKVARVYYPGVKIFPGTRSPGDRCSTVLGDPVPLVSLELMALGAPIPVVPWACPGAPRAGEVTVEIFRQRPELKAILLRNHGLVAIGGSLEQAFEMAYDAKVGFQTYHQALQVGQPVVLSEEQVEEIKTRYHL